MKKLRTLKDHPHIMNMMSIHVPHEAFYAEEAQFLQYIRGDKIIDSNQKVEHLYLILSGKAKICLIHVNGKSSIIDFINAGDYIGELSLLEVESVHKDVVAVCDTICVRVPFSSSKYTLTHDEQFLLGMSRYLGKKSLRRSYFHAKSQSYDLKTRLAAHILQLETDGIYHEKHTETAEFLGVSYRHLLHTMEQLTKEQALIRTQKGFQIDVEKLKSLAADILA